jgi:undecaprenyl-diphosphatase
MLRLSPYALRHEWPIILSLMIAAMAGWAAIELADEVLEGSTHAADKFILLAFRTSGDLSDPIGPAWFEEMMRDFTALGGVGVLVLITFGASGYLLVTGRGKAALAILVAVGGGILISTFAKIGVDRVRPELVPHGAPVSTASFPSGHSMMAAVVYLTLAVMIARVEPRWSAKTYIVAIAMLLTLLVGLSRVYLGVHWPTDVLAGWFIGCAWALNCWLVTLWLQRKGAIEM